MFRYTQIHIQYIRVLLLLLYRHTYILKYTYKLYKHTCGYAFKDKTGKTKLLTGYQKEQKAEKRQKLSDYGTQMMMMMALGVVQRHKNWGGNWAGKHQDLRHMVPVQAFKECLSRWSRNSIQRRYIVCLHGILLAVYVYLSRSFYACQSLNHSLFVRIYPISVVLLYTVYIMIPLSIETMLVCVCVCAHACVCVCMHVCIYMHVCISVCQSTHHHLCLLGPLFSSPNIFLIRLQRDYRATLPVGQYQITNPHSSQTFREPSNFPGIKTK